MKNILQFVKSCIVKSVMQYLKHRRNIQIILGHVMTKKIVCLTCNKELKRSDSLLNHSRLHYPNRNSFQCPVCSSKCLTEKELQMHIVEHIAI